MKKLVLAMCASLMTFAMVTQAQDRKPSVVRSTTKEAKVIVQGIDHDKRELTVKGPQGTRVVKVDDEVRNFDQIKPGDEIRLLYYESVAYSVVKKGEAPDAAAKDVIHRSEKGQKPGGRAESTRQVSATVQAIDPKTREMTLKGPEGNTFTVIVDPRAGDLKRIKKGDEVVATYTESLAIAVNKPK